MTSIDNLSGVDGPRPAPDDVAASIDGLRAEIDDLRFELARLDADLDESRTLNLRAAELLDLVYERLGRAEQD